VTYFTSCNGDTLKHIRPHVRRTWLSLEHKYLNYSSSTSSYSSSVLIYSYASLPLTCIALKVSDCAAVDRDGPANHLTSFIS
jgi:hypothetical protein